MKSARTSRRHPPRRYPAGVHVIRLRPDPKRTLFARVLVFRTQKEMYRYRSLDRDHLACCVDLKVTSYRNGARSRTSPVFAEVCFYRRGLTTETITHEVFHAAVAFGRRIRLDFTTLADDTAAETSADEEALCYAHGRMVTQMVNRLHKLELFA